MHVGHVHYVNNVASVRPILIFVFLLISPTGSARSARDKYESKDKEPFYNLVISVVNNSFFNRVMATITKPPK